MSGISMTRRAFLEASGAVGAVAAVGGGSALADSLVVGGTAEAAADANETVVWSQCTVNCGGGCALRWHVRDGKIAYAETDNTGAGAGLQSRACLRGRSQRRWLDSPDRLMYPMKRTGKRGEGKFERISWDEAIGSIADKLKKTIETYGNEAVYSHYGSGVSSSTSRLFPRLMNLMGGFLGYYGDYSTNMMQASMPYTFGEDWWDGSSTFGSSMSEAEKSDLIVMFGNSPAETRMGGANIVYDYTKVKEKGARIIHIDPRMNETLSGTPDEWLPIRPGTDAALVAAVAHEWIKGDKVDKAFLDVYCVGYDDDTMPASAKWQNKSYKDYIMGSGYDMVEKTPEWAAPITRIPAERIRRLADEIYEAEAPFVVQGWGIQRHSNGENASRAICMLPMLIGQIGLSGTNTGSREANPSPIIGGIPRGKNPVKTTINCYQWLNAIDHGEDMTALKDGVRGADGLKCGIKFLWNYAGNCITNQHGDINRVHDILQDEGKCECIVVVDTVLTDSARYADFLLPDAMRAEQPHMSKPGYTEYYQGVIVGGKVKDPPGEAKPEYEIMSLLAEKLGKKEEFTEGKTQEQWMEELYKKAAAADGDMPSWEKMKSGGIFKRELPPVVALKDFRDDPVANALETPSGKLEIYSEALAEVADTWELEGREVVCPIPVYDPGCEEYQDLTDQYPLQCVSFHFKGRTHSSYGGVEELKQACRNQLWINPADAEARGLKNGDACFVKSAAGTVRIEAKVTPRIIPGAVAIPQGAWHDADMGGDRLDKGGCVNTLTTYRPSPLAKGNAVGSIIVEVTKA